MIHQVFISDMTDPNEDTQLENNMLNFSQVFLDHEYKLWRKQDIEIFLSNNYPDIFHAFNSLTAYAAKADLAKLVIVNHFGGWYYDFYTEPILNIDTDGRSMIFFRDIQKNSSTSFAVAMNVFYSEKNNPVLVDAINIIVNNINNKYYGINPLCPTSVVPFGRAIAMHGENASHLIGDYAEVDGKKVCILTDGEVVANGKQIGGGEIHLSGTNNYNHLWHDKNFYGEKSEEVESLYSIQESD